MRTVYLLLFTCIYFSILAHAESNYWVRIEELSKYNTPQGNPQIESFLKSLTPDQTLQASREYCEQAQTKFTEDQWGPAGIAVGVIMSFYGDEKSALTTERLSSLLKCIVDEKEGLLFRETLTRLLRQRYWRQLTEGQRKQCKQRFLEVLSDKKSPTRIRALNCRELELEIAENYRNIIFADQNVRSLQQDREKSKNLNGLIRSGEVRLDPETRKSLKTVRDEIETITPTLSVLLNDANESPEVKDRAQKALKSLGELPDVSEK